MFGHPELPQYLYKHPAKFVYFPVLHRRSVQLPESTSCCSDISYIQLPPRFRVLLAVRSELLAPAPRCTFQHRTPYDTRDLAGH
jgi:hypothetical protein